MVVIPFKWPGPEPEDLWEQDIWSISRRMALMYYYFARAIIDRLGEREGRQLVKDAIVRYGLACGRSVRERVDALGLEPTAENFRRVPDLPSRGWRRKMVELEDGRKAHVNEICPLAVVWKDLGEEELGRIYCSVDQAKVEGYNPRLEGVHRHNVLDGDPFCEIVIHPRSDLAE